jgi:hypothetical protein
LNFLDHLPATLLVGITSPKRAPPKESRPSNEEAKSRNAQKWQIRQERQKQEAGDCDWPFGSAKERGQSPEEETIKEIIVSVR